jgi:excisionase family DNA binding protein
VTEKLYTTAEVAEMLGFKPDTIIDWYEQGKIDGQKIGGRLRFRRSALDQWLGPETGAIEPERQVGQEAHHCPACCPTAREETARFYRALSRRNRGTL